MEPHQQSSAKGVHNGHHFASLTPYQQLRNEYLAAGLSYKSNEILHKIALLRGYPYAVMLEIAKQFHMNQFEIIFFCHILNDEENCYDADPSMFDTTMPLPELTRIYNRLSHNGQSPVQVIRAVRKGHMEEHHEDDEDEDNAQENGNEGEEEPEAEESVAVWSWKQLAKLYMYLLVIGYSVKYYLNESTKPYEDQIKKRYPDFFTSIFNIWVQKYSEKVLRTNPKKINQFYIDMFQSEDNPVTDNAEIDCQYRNYNEIVEEVIKATTDVDDGGHIEEERDFIQ